MSRIVSILLTLLLLLTACTAPSSEASAISKEQPQESRTEASSSSETSAPEEPTQAPTPEPTPEPTPTPDPLAWYVPLETIPDFETYFATERYIQREDTLINRWETANLYKDDPEYQYFIGETVGSVSYKEFDELVDHNFYRQKKDSKTEKELMAEGDFCDLVITPSWIYLWDTDNVCWRMPYPEGELEKLCKFSGKRNTQMLGNAGTLNPCDNELLLVFTTEEDVYAIYTPTGEYYRMGPLYHRTDWLLPLTNRSYLVHLTTPREENTSHFYYIYSGTENKAYEVDYRSLGLEHITEEDVPLLFPLDENGVPLHGDHLREVSLEEAGMAPGVSAADTDVVL